jgi:putative ABC transport system permease protein
MPDWRPAIRRRIDGLQLPPSREAEIVEELSQHLDDRYQELRAAGATEDAARRMALAELDDTDLITALSGIEAPAREPLALGDARSSARFGGFWQDLRFGARLLTKEKSATAVIVLTLGLAIASNAIVFGFTDLLLLRPLPLGNAARIVTIYGVDHRQGDNRARLSIPDFREVKEHAASLEDVAATRLSRMSLTGAGEPLVATVQFGTANILHVWGVAPVRGRGFLPGDDLPGRPGVAMLSHRFWTAHFAGDETIVGRALTLNGRSYTIVGVLTPAVEIGNIAAIDMWVPLDTSSAAARRDVRSLTVFGLMKPTTALATVSAELSTIADRLERDFPATNAGWRLRAISLREATVGANTWVFLALLAVIVALVLFVACANVATVMLGRASARRREIAVRLALGATRIRLARQLMSEGLLLGLAGGLFGLLLTYFGLNGFERLSEESFFQRLEINTNLLLFTLALSIVAPVLFGLLPALQSSRPNLNEDLKDGSRIGSSPTGGQRSRSILVILQVAFALALLIVAGLVVRSVMHLQHAPTGVTANGVLTAHVRLDPPTYDSPAARLRAVDAMRDRLGALPGATAVAAAAGLPVVDGEPMRQFVIIGRPAPTAADTPWAVEAAVAGAYRQTFDLPLLAGRSWTDDDRSDSPPIALVSREAARRYWSGRWPLGERIQMLDGAGAAVGDVIEIVGVVDDVKGQVMAEPAPPRVYRPLPQAPTESVALAIRVQGNPTALAGAVREALRAIDPGLAVSNIDTMDVLVRRGLRNMDLVLSLFGSFAAVALLLAVSGVYGVTSFSVGQRQHEIGVRLALGANGGDVVRMIMAASLRLIAIGVGFGVGGGIAIGRMMDSVLFGISAVDPITYVVVTGLLAASGLAASYLPAHRALSIDPVAVLKRE